MAAEGHFLSTEGEWEVPVLWWEPRGAEGPAPLTSHGSLPSSWACPCHLLITHVSNLARWKPHVGWGQIGAEKQGVGVPAGGGKSPAGQSAPWAALPAQATKRVAYP